LPRATSIDLILNGAMRHWPASRSGRAYVSVAGNCHEQTQSLPSSIARF
jgi:hypothetical protein